MPSVEEKILNALLAAATGDAMGAVTEQRSTDHIIQRFNGYVTDLIPPPDDNLAHGNPAGLVTDDFSIAYYSAEDILSAGSRPTKELAEKSLIRWFGHPEYTRYIGPTTKKAISALMHEEKQVERTNILEIIEDQLLCNNSRATNGAGMKAGIIGLLNPGNVDRAIDEAIIFCTPTHNNTIALSAGCAIAAATAAAMSPDATYNDTIEAGIYGAAEGYRKALTTAAPVAGGNVEKKIKLAVKIGAEYRNQFDKAMRAISEIIGGGLFAYEAIPAVFGHIAACEGRIKDSVLMGVNGGDDTDTVACMTGYITGALSNSENFPDCYIEKIDKVNNFNLRAMAEKIANYIKEVE